MMQTILKISSACSGEGDHPMTVQGTELFVVYERPSDYPDSFVVRRWQVKAGVLVPDLQPRAVAFSLEEVRKYIPPGLCHLEPSEDDDPVITEVWI